MIDLRRFIHENAEGGFKEFKTQKAVRDALVSFGIDAKAIKNCAGTGLIVDIQGTGPASSAKKGDKTV